MDHVARQSGLPASRTPLKKRIADGAAPYLYSAPALILIVTVMLVPLVLGVSYAFRDIQLLNPFSGAYIGLDHFRALAEDQAFYRALRNTLWWTGASVFFQFVFGLILALLLDKPFYGRGLAQALVFLPWAVPSFLAGLNWAWLFNPVVGPLPHWFYALGIMSEPNNILSDPQLAMWGPIIANVWWGIPFFARTISNSSSSACPGAGMKASSCRAKSCCRRKPSPIPRPPSASRRDRYGSMSVWRERRPSGAISKRRSPSLRLTDWSGMRIPVRPL